jgi:peptide methionine sulfoxide reductase MsrB
VTQNGSTERPFENEFWNHKEEGIYVDVVSGEPLFASVHKFDSGSGWPSFFQTIIPKNVKEGLTAIMAWFGRKYDQNRAIRISAICSPTGLRYCINSAALRFVPKDDLESQGYGEYKYLFDPSVKPGSE